MLFRSERDLSEFDAETVELRKKVEAIGDQVEAIEASARWFTSNGYVPARRQAAIRWPA